MKAGSINLRKKNSNFAPLQERVRYDFTKNFSNKSSEVVILPMELALQLLELYGEDLDRKTTFTVVKNEFASQVANTTNMEDLLQLTQNFQDERALLADIQDNNFIEYAVEYPEESVQEHNPQ